MRHPDFEILALSLPPVIFNQLMSRDDIICNDEEQILNLVLSYIKQYPDQLELLKLVRLEKLPTNVLVGLSKDPGMYTAQEV